ncbi:glycosyltransferase family 2 protein [Thaumasiovibrio sp. DFM-14]|uniref:glycosyltransferase family 2 protein n=1 Tax=Thaumasiovibrio sp. DFM-14 TaxID=3384792 RepID=UPI0039A3043F
MRYGFLVPCYNHGQFLSGVIDNLTRYALPIIVVNDGSDIETTDLINQLQSAGKIDALHLPDNQGKGSAVMAGIRWMGGNGYTHAIQVDADGQHDTDVIVEMLALSQQSPEQLISGCPVYDEAIPKSRLYGRYATHISVWIETLSFEIRDSMMGLRIYPIAASNRLFDRCQIGTRMDFDIEVLVRLYWQGVEVTFVPVAVEYPENGVSHFAVVKDNIRISWLHTRLICGMLPRMPKLLARKFTRSVHWSRRAEKGSVFGIKLLLSIYKRLGRRAFEWLLHFPICYYYLTASDARRASKGYLQAIEATTGHSHLSSYQHIYQFGLSMLDKLSAWGGGISDDKLNIHHPNVVESALESGKGCLILGSHLGDLELCRALSCRYKSLTINALVFTEHAKNFNQVMQQVNPDSALNLIQVNDIGPETMIMLEQKLDAGEWVVIVGDRTSTTQESRVQWTSFLDKPAPFPIGPFLLAGLLEKPTYTLFGFSDQEEIAVYFEPLVQQPLQRKTREQDLAVNISAYANRLEGYAKQYPLHWFNFYDFWKLHNDKTA